MNCALGCLQGVGNLLLSALLGVKLPVAVHGVELGAARRVATALWRREIMSERGNSGRFGQRSGRSEVQPSAEEGSWM